MSHFFPSDFIMLIHKLLFQYRQPAKEEALVGKKKENLCYSNKIFPIFYWWATMAVRWKKVEPQFE
jgi:hypothetical protein